MAPSGFRTLERQRAAVAPGQDHEYPKMQELTAPHIESFNSIWESAGPSTGPLVDIAMELLGKQTVFDGKGDAEHPHGNKLTYWVTGVRLDHPSLSNKETKSKDLRLYPTECRQRAISYRGRLSGVLHCQVNDNPATAEERSFGQLPVMVRSNRCNLKNMGPADLVRNHEEAEEMGGYFIVNGNEKVIRLLVAQRRNHVLAIQRPSYANRGPGFTAHAAQIRCVRRDQTSQTLTMHYLSTGSLLVRFSIRKQEYMVPASLLMRALVGASDKEVFEAIVGADADNIFVRDRVELLLRSSKQYAVYTREQALSFLGDKFRVVMYAGDDASNADVGRLLLQRLVMVHLESDRDKFNMLAHMARKLYASMSGECQTDNPDAQQMQEVYLPGHLYLAIIKEKISDYLLGVRQQLMKDAYTEKADLYNAHYLKRLFARVPADVGQKAQYFLATGNLVSKTGLDMQQVSGYTIIAEKLNFLRYLSHFRCIHRGAFFAELKTTGVRKLLPEAWGFMCPVHTPDGSPCGLLNHLAHKCKLTIKVEDTEAVERALVRLGVQPGMPRPSEHNGGARLLTVQLDGRIVGYCSQAVATRVAETLRALKLKALKGHREDAGIPSTTEIGLVPESHGGQLPGLFLFTTPARFVRPVTHLATRSEDLVGSFEQVYMDIACLDEDVRSAVTTHQEVLPTHILSVVANFTPFCDFNQSPRNMYQCLTVDHEVLTSTGWAPIARVAETDRVMTMELETGAQQWNTVERVAKVAHSTEPLYLLRGDGVDAVCDAAHRWYLNTRDAPNTFASHTAADMAAGVGLESRGAEDWERRDERWVHTNHAIPMVGRNDNTAYTWAECPWLAADSDNAHLDWCRLVGVVMRSGDLEENTLSMNVAGDGSAYATELLSRLAQTVSALCLENGHGPLTWTIASRAVRDFFQPMLAGPNSFDPADAKQRCEYNQAHYRALIAQANSVTGISTGFSRARRWLHYEWVPQLSVAQARALVEGLAGQSIDFSGSISISTASVPLAHDLSIVGLMADARATISGHEYNALDVTLSFSAKDSTAAAPRPEVYENKHHDGFVYCLQVARNGNFMARRRADSGRAQSAFFTGNCQMGKQTMGTPMQSFPYRTDNKLYRIQTGQTPICRPRIYDDYGVDGYPNGANAVVAVISYTGYDMEDAMILNKSAHERGFGYGSIYKTEYVDLARFRKPGDAATMRFGLGRDVLAKADVTERIDVDGLPFPGIRVEDGDALYAVIDEVRGRTRVHPYHGEAGYVETVRLLAGADPELQVVALTFRIPRSPIIGDKFSSRHGQKGVCSVKFPAVDMPFTESGMQPDVIINPHAFPSRMTIGMFVESMAAKAGALHGVCQDATPFQFGETHTAADYFGEQLRRAGYNFHGSEPMYSGVAGTEMRADIYIGVVYYQRLRHMVSDKYQVRSTGPVNPLTMQPIKGRKRGGGIRLGEMERDALIAHGAAYFLQDRLMNCSDYSLAYACRSCGSILAPLAVPATSHAVDLRVPADRSALAPAFATLSSAEARAVMTSSRAAPLDLQCRLCETPDAITTVALPFVFRYLATELMSMNMKVTLDIK